ncbi:lipopolysaccharide kinase InaA family protein [Prolixibacter sp. SD074]|uniref:lipopolysaccharide kinase InaA family protein n=1 Tax=Prolixibacter sp. SD074 TaxID=2652391 RepID=UPI00126C828D|nr:lipopolysaccharide kinase InaA family protein [Prolixibacter sp. SD074]GET27867.1 hypothetical protein SD074_00690 [Prolixibacter sp. SD074]
MKEKKNYHIVQEFQEVENWVAGLKDEFAQTGQTIFKSRNEVKIFEYGDQIYNVKSFKLPNLVNRFVYVYFRGSKAARSFAYAEKLLKLGVPTPQPVAYAEYIRGGVLKESFYVSLHFKYDFTLREVLNYQVSERDRILRQWVAFTYQKLHGNGIFHLDYSPGNTLIRHDGDEYHFTLIDLNRMKFGEIDFEKGLRNFRQLDTDRQTLELLATEYALLNEKDPGLAVRKLLAYDRQNKNYRHRKIKWKKAFRKIIRFGCSARQSHPTQ